MTAHPSSSPEGQTPDAQAPEAQVPEEAPVAEPVHAADPVHAAEAEAPAEAEAEEPAAADAGEPAAGGEPSASQPSAGEPSAGQPSAGEPGPGDRGASDAPPPRARVDARLLEATLLNLRKRVAAIPLVFDVPGTEDASAERGKILSQIDDYLLPRVRQSAAPILVALVGSTGAGKSTLVNSIVGTQVSLTGVRRPTTNSPVLACHPDDIHWFAENMFLPTLPRVRQEGLARPGRDGLLVLAASEKMTRGFALLDTPDIDSVAHSHRAFAYQFLDAADLWLFMTSSARYADAPVWEILQHARERGAALGVVLSRVPRSHQVELVSHFNAMLDANGITPATRFVIPDAAVVDNMLPPELYQPVKDWLTETAHRDDRRVAVLSQTMAGVLDTFKVRVPKLAAHVDAQVALRMGLRRRVETEYAGALTAFDAQARRSALLRGEVLARWQDCAGSGDLGAALSSRRQSRKGRRARKGAGNTRVATLDAALRTAVEALVVAVADRAAEKASAAWRADTAGAALLAGVDASRARDEKAEREFASAFGAESAAWAASVAAGFRSGAAPQEGVPAASSPSSRSSPSSVGSVGSVGSQSHERPAGTLDRSSPDLAARAVRAVGAWQDHLVRLMQAEGQANQATRAAIRGGHDTEPLSLLAMIAVLGDDAPAGPGTGAGRGTGTGAGPGAGSTAGGADGAVEEIVEVPRKVLSQAFGEPAAAGLLTRARADLTERIRLLLDEELLRFVQVLDAAGPIDPVAAVRLYQAEYNLEAVR